MNNIKLSVHAFLEPVKRDFEYVPDLLQGNLLFISAFGVETQPLFWYNIFHRLNVSSYGYYGYIKLAIV